jgi:hypothetical protein
VPVMPIMIERGGATWRPRVRWRVPSRHGIPRDGSTAAVNPFSQRLPVPSNRIARSNRRGTDALFGGGPCTIGAKASYA